MGRYASKVPALILGATPPVVPASRWRRVRVFVAVLALVTVWQLLVIGRDFFVTAPLPDPDRVGSVNMLSDPVAPARSPLGYDLTIFVFSDYQCPSCRLLHPDLERAVSADGHIRLVYKDWIVFGARSRRAARLAIAAQWQGQHAAANDLFMRGATGLDDAALAQAATRSGVNWNLLQQDLHLHDTEIAASLERTDREARLLGLRGTPTLVIGNLLYSGRLDNRQLPEAISLARSR